MHVSGCKTWHTHGAAGRKVAGKSSGTRRNPSATMQTIEAKIAEYRRKAHVAEQNAGRARDRGNDAAAERYLKQWTNNLDRMRAWQAKLY